MLGIVCNYTLLALKFALCIFSHCSKSIEKKIKRKKGVRLVGLKFSVLLLFLECSNRIFYYTDV